MTNPHLAVAIPASLVSDIPHLREKTTLIGTVGRALAIFRVDEAIIYRDRPGESQDRDIELATMILRYMETPQYLRKRLFPKMPPLRYAGILPPLRTPHHPLTKRIRDLRDGECREGVVVSAEAGKPLVDVGVERPICLNERGLSIGQRITVRVIKKHQRRVGIERIEKPNSNVYWGYRVDDARPTLGRLIRGGSFDLVVATSRRGKPFTETVGEFKKRWRTSRRVLVAFGSPREGLREILEYEGMVMDGVAQLIVNTIPRQGTETVRTEEALYAALAVINAIVRRGV